MVHEFLETTFVNVCVGHSRLNRACSCNFVNRMGDKGTFFFIGPQQNVTIITTTMLIETENL